MEYAIFIKHSEEGKWLQLGWKWYISPKKAMAAYKATPYPHSWDSFYSIKMVERTVIVSDKDLLDFVFEK